MVDEPNEDENKDNPEPTGNADPEPNPTDNNGGQEISDLDRAEAINKEKARLLEEEKKLVARKEKLEAIRQVGGRTVGGQEAMTPQQVLEDKAKKEAEEIVNAFR